LSTFWQSFSTNYHTAGNRNATNGASKNVGLRGKYDSLQQLDMSADIVGQQHVVSIDKVQYRTVA